MIATGARFSQSGPPLRVDACGEGGTGSSSPKGEWGTRVIRPTFIVPGQATEIHALGTFSQYLMLR